ncbi:MAG: hypothetical protein J2P20_08785 [Pseudonocardia sp.]|nr:hypothetical protein [Pseudonocardia sp.]
MLGELAKHLVAAAKDRDAREPGRELVRRSPGEVARLRAGADRSLRIEAGRKARRLPYVYTGVTAAAGYSAWGGAEFAEALAGPAGHIAATCGTAGLCCAALTGLRVWHRHGIRPEWVRRWWTAGAAAAAWVTGAAAAGPASWAMSAALAAGATAVSARWLREHEVPMPGMVELPPVEPEPAEDDFAQTIAERWAEHVACQGGPLPKALLTGREDLPNAIRWTVQTKPGSSDFDTFVGAHARIASGLRLPTSRVVPERGEDESAPLLSVITRDVLAEGVPYTGPRYEDGRIFVGPFADGTGDATYYAYDEVGCRSGLAAGAPGSGKTAFLESIALALRSSNEWYVPFGDGDPGGGSSPLLNRISHWPAAGPQEVLAQLEAMEKALHVRTMLKPLLTLGPDGRTPVPITDPDTQIPVREMIPCPEFPGICWVLDELHRLTKDEWLAQHNFVGRLEKLVRIGRKYGIVVLAGSQSLLVEDYGGSTPLRAWLSARNLWAFRSTNKTETAVVQGLTIAPGTLPQGGGFAFCTADGRLCMHRVAWSRDMSSYAAELPWAALDADTDLAVAAYRPDKRRDPAEQYRDQLAKLARWRAERRTGIQPDHARPAESGPSRPLLPGLAGLAQRIPAALTADNVIRLPGPVQTPDGPDVEGLRRPHRLVYDALKAGHRRTGDIAAATGLLLPAVSKALAALADYGLAVKLAHGEWAATPTDQTSQDGDGPDQSERGTG